MNNKFIDVIKTRYKNITIFIIIFAVMIVLLSGMCFAKYYQDVSMQGNANIAKPIIFLESGDIINVTNNDKEGTYEFSVKNYNEKDEITEVSLNYYIELIANTDELIKYEIYKDDEKLQFDNNRTEEIQIGHIDKEEHKYKLKILYDKDANTNIYNIIENIQIKLHSEQERNSDII